MSIELHTEYLQGYGQFYLSKNVKIVNGKLALTNYENDKIFLKKSEVKKLKFVEFDCKKNISMYTYWFSDKIVFPCNNSENMLFEVEEGFDICFIFKKSFLRKRYFDGAQYFFKKGKKTFINLWFD